MILYLNSRSTKIPNVKIEVENRNAVEAHRFRSRRVLRLHHELSLQIKNDKITHKFIKLFKIEIIKIMHLFEFHKLL